MRRRAGGRAAAARRSPQRCPRSAATPVRFGVATRQLLPARRDHGLHQFFGHVGGNRARRDLRDRRCSFRARRWSCRSRDSCRSRGMRRDGSRRAPAARRPSSPSRNAMMTSTNSRQLSSSRSLMPGSATESHDWISRRCGSRSDPQRQARAVQSCFDGADVDAQHAGDLFVLETFDVAQQQNGSVDLRQLVDAFAHLVRATPPSGARRGAARARSGPAMWPLASNWGSHGSSGSSGRRRRLRRRISAALTVIRCSQVERRAVPSKRSIARKADRKASCTTSFASASPTSRVATASMRPP